MEYRNAQRNAFGTIDCEINHPVYGWIPTTASADDAETAVLFATLDLGDATLPAPAPDIAALATTARAQRAALLQHSDWTQVADAPVDQAAWATYRQALRDITVQPGFPADIDWPTRPE